MMRFLRSQSQTVLVIVLGVIGLGFLFYGASGNLLTSMNGRVNNDYGRIDGQDLTVADLTNAVRNTRDAIKLSPQAQELSRPGASAQVAEKAWGQLLFLHEADRLHIEISDQELGDYIRSLPIFQKDGVYSPDIYRSRLTLIQNVLRIPSDAGADPLTSTEAVIETVMRNTLRINAVRDALFSTVRSPATEVSDQYEKYYGPTTVSVITFDPKTFIDKASVTPEEIGKVYKDHPENPAYRTKEKRKVDYVLLSLTPEQAKLPDTEKAAAKEALGEKALDFVLALQPEPSATPGATPPPPDFMTEAKKRGLAPVTSDFFTADTPPANVPPSPSFNSAAFSLTKDNTISKVVELDNGVAVLRLVEIQPSDLLPLDQVQADIAKQLRQAKGMQAAQAAAQALAKALQTAVTHGVDFKAAAASMGQKVDTVSAFVPIQASPTDTRLQTIAYAATTLAPGQVSEPVPVQSDNTLLIVHLDSRAKADPAGLADFESHFRESQDQQLRSLVYLDWVNWKGKQPGTHPPPDLDIYGGVE